MKLFRLGFAGLCCVPVVLALTSGEGRAWNAEAHMIIALVADRLLEAQESPAQKKIGDLLAGDKSTPGPERTSPARPPGRMRWLKRARRGASRPPSGTM